MKKNLFSLLLGVFFLLINSKLGCAQEINDIGSSIVESTKSLPGLVSAFAYMAGLLVAVSAIFKAIDHVTNPAQTPFRVPAVRVLLAGALFSLPMIAEVVTTTINGGSVSNFKPATEAYTYITSTLSSVTSFFSGTTNINSIMNDMIGSVEFMPALVSAVAYLLGLIMMLSALFKTRDHVEDPNSVPLKDAVIRYLTAGALFALPTIYEAMYYTVAGSGLGPSGTIWSIVSSLGFLYSTETNAIECATLTGLVFGTGGVGSVICNAMLNSTAFPTFMNAVAYLLGLVLGLWGILKIRDHVIEPSKTALSEGVMRLIAGGAFFSLPYIMAVVQRSFLSDVLSASASVTTNTMFRTSSFDCSTTNSLDEAMGCFMQDILGPTHIALNFFSYVAGMIFIMIGISRLIKSSQEGARGPGGIGTFGTFVVGGLLLSATTILRAFSSSLFGSPITYTYATLNYTAGMTKVETDALYNVIAAVLQFLIVLGMISFVRGMFIMRDVAEGSSNASTMSGVTHLIGGALAVNMGPFLNAIQETLGITAFGVSFGL